MSIQWRIGVALVIGALAVGAGAAQAERITIAGNAGTITLDWQATQDRAGRPLITGHVGVSGVAQAFEELASPERHAKILVHPER